MKLAKQSVRDETNNESDEKKERENISDRICIISRADFISVKQYSEGLGKNITHKIIYTLPNMRSAVVKVSGIYYGKAKRGFISAVDVLNKDINWRSKEHEFCSGAIGGFGVQNPMAKMEYYKNGPKTKEILQREQTKISLYERRYDSGNNKKIWHSKINLSFIPADNVIQLYSLRCHCGHCLNRFNQDTIVDCTAYVNTKRGKEVPVTVQYCSGCGSFFMNYDVYEGYQAKYGALQFECRLERSAYENDMDIGFADTSFLSRAGYSVKASVSQRRRQIILKGLLDSGNYSKWEITEKISEFIQLRKNNPDMRDAIKRWEEDIAFVADYDADNQTNVGKGTLKQGGKITRRENSTRKQAGRIFPKKKRPLPNTAEAILFAVKIRKCGLKKIFRDANCTIAVNHTQDTLHSIIIKATFLNHPDDTVNLDSVPFCEFSQAIVSGYQGPPSDFSDSIRQAVIKRKFVIQS